MTQSSPALELFRTFRAGEVPRGENMLYSGTNPESYITEYTLVYEDCGNARLLTSLSTIMRNFGLVVERRPRSGVGRSDNCPAFCYKAREVCEDQVLDGPASGGKGSKSGNSLDCIPEV